MRNSPFDRESLSEPRKTPKEATNLVPKKASEKRKQKEGVDLGAFEKLQKAILATQP